MTEQPQPSHQPPAPEQSGASVPLYSADVLPRDFEVAGGAVWAAFRKVSLTSAIRIEGPFRVETSESENEPFYCEDGWLALDARGYPYAIADEEFQKIYEPVVSDGDEGLAQARQTQPEVREVNVLEPEGHVLQIIGTEGPLVTIGRDLEIAYGEGYSPDQAADIFWNAVAKSAGVVVLEEADRG